MEEYSEDGEEYNPVMYNEVDPQEYVEQEGYPYDDDVIYNEQTRGGYMDDENYYDTEPNYGGGAGQYNNESEYYDLYNPDFQKFLLKNGIIKFDSDDDDDDDDDDDSSSSSDDDYSSRNSKRGKKTSRKKSQKKKTTRKKR